MVAKISVSVKIIRWPGTLPSALSPRPLAQDSASLYLIPATHLITITTEDLISLGFLFLVAFDVRQKTTRH